MRWSPIVVLLAFGCALGSLPGCSERAEPSPSNEPAEGAPPEIARPYEEGVDAQAQIDAAVARARDDGKRVLLVFGANWCPWCRRLEHTLRNDEGVASDLRDGFRVVHVDVGARGSDVNRQVAARYGDPLSNGLPCIVVLDREGEVAHVQETGSLESGDRHDPALVRAFLARWRAG